MEKIKATATDIVLEINKLKTNLKERQDNVFITHETKKVIKALVEKRECQEDWIKNFPNFVIAACHILNYAKIVLEMVKNLLG